MAEILHIPIFPLPNVVFFPGTVLPLHIFEPRYRRLVNDVLGGDRRFAVFLQRPPDEAPAEGEPPPFEIGCVGEIVRAEALPDGRFNLLHLGLARIRLHEVVTDVPYRVAAASPAPERPAQVADDAAAAFRSLARTYFRNVLGRPPRDAFEGQPLEKLVNTVSANLEGDALERQRLLEAPTLPARLARVAELMTGQVEARRVIRSARDRRPPDPRVN
jgi:Lon protease-like protein